MRHKHTMEQIGAHQHSTHPRSYIDANAVSHWIDYYSVAGPVRKCMMQKIPNQKQGLCAPEAHCCLPLSPPS